MAMRQRYNFQTGRYEYVDARTGRPAISSLSSGVPFSMGGTSGGLVGSPAAMRSTKGTGTGADFANTGWDWRQSDIDWIARREETLARDQSRIDELGRKRQSVGLTASEEIEFQALMNKLNLMMEPTQRQTISGSNKLLRTTEKPETGFEAAQRQQLEDQRFFDEYEERRRDIMTGSLIDQDERMRELETEYQIRSAREAGRGLIAAKKAAETEKARVAAATEEAREISKISARDVEAAARQQAMIVQQDQRAAFASISEIVENMSRQPRGNPAALKFIMENAGLLNSGLNPVALKHLAKGAAMAAYEKEELRNQAKMQSAEASEKSKKAEAQARVDYRKWTEELDKADYVRKNRQEIQTELNKSRVRIANLSAQIGALAGNKDREAQSLLEELKIALAGEQAAYSNWSEILSGITVPPVTPPRFGEPAPSEAPAPKPAPPPESPPPSPSENPIVLVGRPDPASLIPGQVYSYNGQLYRWNGTNFDPLGG